MQAATTCRRRRKRRRVPSSSWALHGPTRSRLGPARRPSGASVAIQKFHGREGSATHAHDVELVALDGVTLGAEGLGAFADAVRGLLRAPVAEARDRAGGVAFPAE